jgi:hypothetical protein
MHKNTVGSYGGDVSYERGTLVGAYALLGVTYDPPTMWGILCAFVFQKRRKEPARPHPVFK